MNDYYSKFPEPQAGVDYAPSSDNTGPSPQQNQYVPPQSQPHPTAATYTQNQPQSSFGGQGIVIGTGAPVSTTQNVSGGYQTQPQYQQPAPSGPSQYPQFESQPYNPYEQSNLPGPSYNNNQYNAGTQVQQGGYPTMQQGGQVQGQYQAQPQNPYAPQPYIHQQQAQPQPQPQPQPNVGYYYGYWGPQLQRNQ